ncbi:esterase family protein [Radiobacillus kanasensis]|uniref:alpha/beta hydrolase n=1 Tax=Radiobacillus kanasensis TaxID=2844358 RepID=UPI001E3D3B37|nr:alpha/beta hydrolase-fold protein [Radiobacillus kanasensis]UFU00595.1 esterase family protein [Radiobacillus kanasensis]
MQRKGKMMEHQIASKYLGETMTIKWYVPEMFSPLKSYHLCIMQDGEDYFRIGKIATWSDQLHEDGEIEDTVFVGIHYKDKYDRLDKYHPDGTKLEAYMNFLVKEVVPFLDEEIPTFQIGGSRTLMGDSMAGTFALMAALRYPNTFGQVIMQSPFVNKTVMDSVSNAKFLDQLSIYHTVGNQETEVQTTRDGILDFITPNRELHQLLDSKGTSYEYHEFDGKHTWKYWQQDMKRALTTMFGF